MFKLPYDLIVFDLELNQPSNKIIEIGAVKLLRNGQLHPSEFQSLVNPHEKLGNCTSGTQSITELTGISQTGVDCAVDLSEAVQKFAEFAFSDSKNVILACWGPDAPIFNTNCENQGVINPFRRKTVDIKSMVVFYGALHGIKAKNDSLVGWLKCFESGQYSDRHRALPDAKATARLLMAIIARHNHTIQTAQILAKLVGP